MSTRFNMQSTKIYALHFSIFSFLPEIKRLLLFTVGPISFWEKVCIVQGCIINDKRLSYATGLLPPSPWSGLLISDPDLILTLT